MDVVLIPAWRRPEFLWHCLANIKRAHGASDLHYIFRFDAGHDKDLYKVIADFPFSHQVSVTPRTNYRMAKQSFSLLTGYQQAAQRSDGLVFMIEEDVMVRQDFFQWHRAVHDQQPGLFCSIAVKNHNRQINEDGGEDEYYLTDMDFCSLGLCWRREVLLDVVLPYASREYYLNPPAFIARNFKGAPFGEFYEQDGLLRRIQWHLANERHIAYPFRPRAYHAGLYGANRGRHPTGTLAQRMAYVTSMIYDAEAMRNFASSPDLVADSIPINLNFPEPCPAQKQRTIDPNRDPARL